MDVLSNDLKIKIISKMRYIDILELQLVNKEFNKICDDNVLWNKLINRDFGFYSRNGNGNKERYQYLFRYLNKYAKNIMSAFVLRNIRYDKLPQTYEEIFTLLVEYLIKINVTDKDINKQNWLAIAADKYQITEEDLEVEYNTIHKIFVVCNIMIADHPEFIKNPPGLGVGYIGQIKTLDINRWTQLRRLIYEMLNDYQEY